MSQKLNCQNYNFSEHEYKALREEQRMRVEWTSGQGFSLCSVILILWAAMIAFCGDFYNIASATDSVIGKSAGLDALITFVIMLFCGFPCIIAYPFSIKYRDNIRQIVSIATYLRVFYEFPSYLHKENKDGLYGWELIHCSHNIPRGNKLAWEYFLISIVSTILSLLMGFICFFCIFQNDYLKLNSANYIQIGIGIAVCALFLIFLCYSVWIVKINTKITKLFEKYGKVYLREYCDAAIKLNFLSQDEVLLLEEIMEKTRERDDRLNNL